MKTTNQMMMNFLNAVEENGTDYSERPYEEHLTDFGISDNVLVQAEFFQIYKAVKLYHYAQDFKHYLIDLAYHWNFSSWDSPAEVEEHKETMLNAYLREEDWKAYTACSQLVYQEEITTRIEELHWEENQDIIKFCYGMGPLSDERLLQFTFPTLLTEDEPVYPNIYEG